jgi:hypothetical protein
VCGLAAPLAVYSTQVYPELPAALVTTVAIAVLTSRLDRSGQVALATAIVTLPWLSAKYVPMAAALALTGVARLLRRGDRRPAALLVLGLVAVWLIRTTDWSAPTATRSTRTADPGPAAERRSCHQPTTRSLLSNPLLGRPSPS